MNCLRMRMDRKVYVADNLLGQKERGGEDPEGFVSGWNSCLLFGEAQ